MQRRKGRKFEQWVATKYRKRYPKATVRRALQAHQPYESDVMIEGDAPEIAIRIWTECEDAASPCPKRKMKQALRDIYRAQSAGRSDQDLAVVVWHRTGSRTRSATVRICDLMVILGHELPPGLGALVTMDFEDFLELLPGG